MNWASLRFDSNSPNPIYRQLYEHVLAIIESGELSDGSRLPPTRELAGLLGLNRTTVAAAYQALENDGLIKAHVGRGSFVCASNRPVPFSWEGRFRTSAPNRRTESAMWLAGEDCINFSSAWLDASTFSAREVLHAAQDELSAHCAAVLQLGAAEGYPPLREYLSAEMRREGIAETGDELLVTSGCQQALDLIAKIFVSSGDTVLLEDPVYPGARDLFLAAGAQVAGVSLGPSGLSPAELEQEMARRRPQLLVVTPNFQNPTGATLDFETRRQVLHIAARFQVAVVENDVYAGLRYSGSELPALKSLDRDGRVIYLRSFSKVAFPGLRVGWCVAPKAVIDRLASAKQLTDLHTDQLSQAVLHRLAAEGGLASRLGELRRHGAERLAAVVESCREEMPPGVSFSPPEGGMHLWLRLPPPLDASELLARARAQKVLFVPGRFFAVTQPHSSALRISFAGLPPEKIRQGITTLARVIRAQAPAASEISPAGLPALV